jgi:hypothetical protein
MRNGAFCVRSQNLRKHKLNDTGGRVVHFSKYQHTSTANRKKKKEFFAKKVTDPRGRAIMGPLTVQNHYVVDFIDILFTILVCYVQK